MSVERLTPRPPPLHAGLTEDDLVLVEFEGLPRRRPANVGWASRPSTLFQPYGDTTAVINDAHWASHQSAYGWTPRIEGSRRAWRLSDANHRRQMDILCCIHGQCESEDNTPTYRTLGSRCAVTLPLTIWPAFPVLDLDKLADKGNSERAIYSARVHTMAGPTMPYPQSCADDIVDLSSRWFKHWLAIPIADTDAGRNFQTADFKNRQLVPVTIHELKDKINKHFDMEFRKVRPLEYPVGAGPEGGMVGYHFARERVAERKDNAYRKLCLELDDQFLRLPFDRPYPLHYYASMLTAEEMFMVLNNLYGKEKTRLIVDTARSDFRIPMMRIQIRHSLIQNIKAYNHFEQVMMDGCFYTANRLVNPRDTSRRGHLPHLPLDILEHIGRFVFQPYMVFTYGSRTMVDEEDSLRTKRVASYDFKDVRTARMDAIVALGQTGAVDCCQDDCHCSACVQK